MGLRGLRPQTSMIMVMISIIHLGSIVVSSRPEPSDTAILAEHKPALLASISAYISSYLKMATQIRASTRPLSSSATIRESSRNAFFPSYSVFGNRRQTLRHGPPRSRESTTSWRRERGCVRVWKQDFRLVCCVRRSPLLRGNIEGIAE